MLKQSLTPFVSVILPNFNHEFFLEERIESILNQTYQNFELILLDDSSVDESVKILNKYKANSKVASLEINEKNSGTPFVQWHKGIKKAKGEYIWIAESDDYCELNFLETCVSKLLSDEKLSLVFSNTWLCNVESNEKQKMLSNKPSGTYHAWDDNFIHDWFYGKSSFRIVNASACVFRRNFINLEKMESLPTYKLSGDRMMWLSLLLDHPNFYYIEEALNYQNAHLLTTRSQKTWQSLFLRIEEVLRISKLADIKFDPNDEAILQSLARSYIVSAFASYKIGKGFRWKQMWLGIRMLNWNLDFLKRFYKIVKTHK